jgi:hypothetical protein
MYSVVSDATEHLGGWERFSGVTERALSEQHIIVVHTWYEELKRLVRAN